MLLSYESRQQPFQMVDQAMMVGVEYVHEGIGQDLHNNPTESKTWPFKNHNPSNLIVESGYFGKLRSRRSCRVPNGVMTKWSRLSLCLKNDCVVCCC
jgi:hypothetical protein